METLDIIILVCFIPAIIRGIRKGFIDQILGLISLVLGAWMAFHCSSAVSGWLEPYLEVSPTVLNIISFVIIVSGVVLGLYLLGLLLTKIIEIVFLGWVNRLLGFVFALLMNALVLSLIIILFDTLNSSFGFVENSKLEASALYGPLRTLGYTVFPYLKSLLFLK